MLLSKVKQRDNVNKTKPPPTFRSWCRNLKSKKTIGGGGVNQLVKVTVNIILVSITSKNTPSGYSASRRPLNFMVCQR